MDLRETHLGTVLIPAHNEGPVIGRCLDALLTGLPDDVRVMVLCNGCTDATAEVARARGHRVQVVETEQASKTHAIRNAEAMDPPFPRLYLDADVELSGSSVVALLDRLRTGQLAARPPIDYGTEGSSRAVQRYYRARSRVPELMSALWGAGCYGLSREGRSRFGEYPEVIGDDLWIDGQFARDEIAIVDCEPVKVRVPRSSRHLLRILRRAQRGKREGDSLSSRRSTTSTARGLLATAKAPIPSTVADVATFIAFATAARVSAAILPDRVRWERDDSSRFES